MAKRYLIYEEDIPIPNKIFLDSNFIIALFSAKSEADLQNKSLCESFLEKLKQHKVELFTSDLAFNEVYHVIMKRIFSGNLKEQYKEDPTRIKSCFSELDEILKACNKIGLYSVRVDKKLNLPLIILEKIKSYCLLSNDASHSAIAEYNKINSIASLDNDFNLLPNNICLYTLGD